MQRYNILNHLECASQQSHPRERIDVSLSIGQNTTPSVSFFSRGSFRPKKYFPTARFESYLLSTLLPSLFLPLSLPFEVRARIYIALDGVTDTQPGHAGMCLRGLYALAQGAFLFPYKAVRFPAARPLKKTRERGFPAPPFDPPTLQPPLFPLLCRLAERCDF